MNIKEMSVYQLKERKEILERMLIKKIYLCSCIKCGFEHAYENHCNKYKCPKCGGDMRRKERPGAGKENRPKEKSDVEKKKKPKKKQNPEKIVDEMLELLSEIRTCPYREVGNVLSQIESLNRQVRTGEGDAIVTQARKIAMRRRLLGR